MNTPTSFTCKFTLDKAHFNECYSQSNTVDRSANAYFKGGVLMLFGLIILLFTPVNAYAAWFVIALGILEALAIYYSQPWWVLRQMLSKASGSEVTVTIDEQGVLSESFYHTGRILWSEVSEIKNTSLGFVLHFTAGKSTSKSYLSKACLTTSAQEYIVQKVNR
ncbi:YcxB family protein [Candidatus Colwellia aromaticivorans]|uniref:YcxB family protein n=1 Tax=Candidatus Colwellia aromaticivorans TaxID=2267621 RepID=UPI000DF353BF|nr:YcxB family protein [Candidatus Colwellia aromaticivorans]